MNIVMPGKAAEFAARQREQADKLRAQRNIEPQPWYRITNQTDPDEAEVMLYDEVGGWYGATADQFIADLRGITSPNIRLRVNSPGGQVFEGIAIANALRSHPATVVVQVDGIAASIASVIAMAGDRVEMAPNTMLMIHDASGLCMGNAADMEEMAELLDLISDNIADAYAAKAGGTRESWREQMRAESWFLPEDAVKAGLADEAITMPKTGTPVEGPPTVEPEPEMHREFDLTAYGYQGPKQPERPKPAPPKAAGGIVDNPPVVGEDSCTLTIPIGSALGEQLAAALRACVEPAADPAPESTPEAAVATPAEPDAAETVDTTTEAEPATEAVVEQPVEAEPQLAPPTAEPESVPPADGEPAEPEAPVEEPTAWAAAVAHLTTPRPNPWADAFAHLVNPQPSSSAATAA